MPGGSSSNSKASPEQKTPESASATAVLHEHTEAAPSRVEAQRSPSGDHHSTEAAAAIAATTTSPPAPSGASGKTPAAGIPPLRFHVASGYASTLDSRLTSVTPTPKRGAAALQNVPSLSLCSAPISPSADGDGFYAGAPTSLLQFASLPGTPQPGAQHAQGKPGQAGMDNGVDGAGGGGGDALKSAADDTNVKHTNYNTYTEDMDEDNDDGDGNPNDNAGQSGESRRHLQDSFSLEYTSFAGPLDVSFRATGGAKSSLKNAVFHIFKGNVGAGVFLLPTYYTDAGYVLGFIGVMLLGAMMVDCCLTLLSVKLAINDASVHTYPGVVDFVLGKWFKRFTMFSLIFTQFGFCIMFLQYSASMFSALFDVPFMYELFIIIGVAVVTPMTFLSHKMEVLAYASLFAGVCVVVVLAGTTAVDVQHIATNGAAAGIAAFYPTMHIFTFLSGHMFSLEGIGIVLPVENSLAEEDKPAYRDVIKYTLTSIVSFYIFFGILGYVAYGDSLRTSVVLALPPGPIKVLLQILLGISLLFGYPIQFVPAIQLVDKAFNIDVDRDRKKSLAVRFVLNIAFGIAALFIGAETLNIFASFLGAFAGVHLMLTLPSLLGLLGQRALDGERERRRYGDYLLLLFKGPFSLARCRFYVYLLLAVSVWIAGTYFTFESVFLL